MSRILITGGAGFIGANLTRLILGRSDAAVVVLDDLSTGSLDNLAGLDIDFIEGSVEDPQLVKRAAQGVDAIVHLGALGSVPLSVDDPGRTHRVNSTGSLNVLEAARHGGGPHVTVASSAANYGSDPELPKRETMAPGPESPYAASKLAMEHYAASYASSYGLDVIVFRFFNVFGPWQPAGHAYAPVIPAFLDAALSGRTVQIHGDGGQTRDFISVATVCETLLAGVAQRITSARPVNLATGHSVSLLDVLDQLEGLLQQPIPREHGEVRQGDIRHSAAAIDRLRALFPTIEPEPLEAALANTIQWWQR